MKAPRNHEPIEVDVLEKEHHDHIARSGDVDRTIYTSMFFALHDRYIEPLLTGLQDKRVVDCGCGPGRLLIRLAQEGAEVYGFDISLGMVELARERIRQQALVDRVCLGIASFEHSGFQEEIFDVVFGMAILHHTDLAKTRAETYRILKPGGEAFFFEPLGGNPVIELFRWLTPHLRTPAERPLSLEDIKYSGEPFTWLDHQEVCLVSLLSLALLAASKQRPIFEACMRLTEPVDDFLLSKLPFLRRLCGFSLIHLLK